MEKIEKNGLKEKEWSPDKKWNPFNSYKLLGQIYRWREIRRNNSIPQPATISIDPINRCNLKCVWCNSDFILGKNRGMLSGDTLIKIAEFLAKWQGSKSWGRGVESVCVGGGGESLLNPHTGEFIEKCIELGIEVGLVTNGVKINDFIEPLSKCTWVGVSVDAGSPGTFKKLKKVDSFDVVIDNIKELVAYSESNNTRLSKPGRGYGVSYKYLLYPGNENEIYEAARIAKSLGCRNMHMRPASIPWDQLVGSSDKKVAFDKAFIRNFREQVESAREFEDEKFGIFGITHKFDDGFDKANWFTSCHAIFMTGVFMPTNDDSSGAFNFGLCCDRRGDDDLLLGKNLKSPDEVGKLWGSEKHWQIFDKIQVASCPRCTYQPHNQIYEHVILTDNMTYKFI